MRIVWSGVHEHRKALPILLEALSQADDACVDVLGVGPCTKKWKGMAEKLAVANRVTWRGWIKREDAVRIISKADVFAITSIHDLTSTVLLEALSAGKPVVCLDHCGFADVVDETCGIKVSIGEPKDVIRGFADAIRRLMDADLRARLSQGAFKKAAEYAWSKKRETLSGWLKPEWKKIVVGCYACSPYRGSEPGMGWNYLRAVAAGREVWAIVEQEKWQHDIEKYLDEHPDEMQTVHWIFVHKPRARFLRKVWPPSYYWFYRIWQWRAYKKAKELNAVHHFDAAYQLNMVTFREPGYLWKLPTPFVWGPVGGLGYTDTRLFGLLDVVGKFEFAMRNAINWLHCHLMSRPRIAARKSAETDTLIAATGENRREMKKLWGVEAKLLCEIGV